MSTYYVTTSVPYVNDRPHIGFALELVQADVLARWHRLRGDDTFFLTGTDENALKNVRAAAREGLSPRKLCDRNADHFRKLVRALDISADAFIRTSSEAHHRGASQFWSSCRKTDFYLKRYRGLYCVGCEDFYLERDLANGRCPTHRAEPELVEEENYFFRLSAYQKQAEDLIASGRLQIVPGARRNEALAFVRSGLRDYSISRVRERSGGWGIPVPGDPSQVLYVWFDALTNYLTGLGYGSDPDTYGRYWCENPHRVHVIGKDVLRFHAVYWPTMLLSAGLPLPTTLLVHGFLTVDGRKISKSLGHAPDPLPYIERYGADAVRYYLLRTIPTGADGDFSEPRLREVYAADLVHGLGNLARRLETLCERSGYGARGAPPPRLPDGLAQLTEGHRFHDALRVVWDRIRDLNREIESGRPWDLLRDGDTESLHHRLSAWVAGLRSIALGLAPFLPETAEKIERSFTPERIVQGDPLFPGLT